MAEEDWGKLYCLLIAGAVVYGLIWKSLNTREKLTAAMRSMVERPLEAVYVVTVMGALMGFLVGLLFEIKELFFYSFGALIVFVIAGVIVSELRRKRRQ